MNKFQRIATQMAKDDIKKGYCKYFSFKKLKNIYYGTFKNDDFPIGKALDYKEWNKTCGF